MENSPLVSICIPVYNGENTVLDAVNSALSQTYPNLEVVVVDNCSTDKTYELLKGISDPRLKLSRNTKNLGMVGNWNKTIALASGEYAHMLHSDDLMDATCIEKKVKAVLSHSDITLVFNDTKIIDGSGKLLFVRRYANKNKIIDGKKLAIKALMKRNIYGEPSNVLFKRDLFNKAGGFFQELKYATDLDMWIRISVLGAIAYVAEPLVSYRAAKGNVTSSLSLREIIKDDNIMMKHIKDTTELRISFVRGFYHKFVYATRAIMRVLYMKIFSRKSKAEA